MKKLATAMVASLVAILAGCSSLSVNQDFDPDFDFADAKTFSVAPFDSKMGMDQITYKEMKKAITENLTAKGMSVSDNSADLTVSVTAGKQQETEISQEGYGWMGTDVYQYEEGTVVVNILDTGSQKLVWRGVGTGDLKDNPTQQEKQYNINNLITKLLQPFPPQTTS